MDRTIGNEVSDSIEEELEEDDIESRIDGLIDAEEELRKELEQSPVEWNDEETITTLPISGGEKEGDQITFDVYVNNSTVQVELPWPSDPQDPSEPLMKLAEWNGTTIDNIASCDEMPVLHTENNLYYVPLTGEINERIVICGHKAGIIDTKRYGNTRMRFVPNNSSIFPESFLTLSLLGTIISSFLFGFIPAMFFFFFTSALLFLFLIVIFSVDRKDIFKAQR